MLKQIDVFLKNSNIERLYASLSVKLHGCLMDMIEPALAAELHSENVHPFSIYVYEKQGCHVLRLSILNERMTPLINACLNAKAFHVTGVSGDIEVIKTIVFPNVDVMELQKTPPPRRVRITFLSAATYKLETEYRNWFSLYYLLNSVAIKLRKYEGIGYSDEFLALTVKCTDITEYSLFSRDFDISRGEKINGFIGDVTLANVKNAEYSAALILLLRYAGYTGLGAKTALGMGGVVLEELS